MIPMIFFTALALAGFSTAKFVKVEDTSVLPVGWEKIDQAVDPSHTLRLSIALRQPDIDNLKTSLRRRDCTSGKYTQNHLTQKEALALRDPDQKDVSQVLGWLKSKGFAAKATPDKDWIHVKTTVKAAEDLLDTKIGFYKFEGQKPVLRTNQYSVPESVADAVNFIHPIANFMRPKKELTTPDPALTPSMLETLQLEKRATPCSQAVTPDCLREQYNISYAAYNGSSQIRFGIAGFLEENANYQDSNDFLRIYAKPLYEARYNFSVQLINGANNSQELFDSGNEAALDIQYGMALGYPTNITYYLADGRGPTLDDDGEELPEEYNDNEPYLEFLDYLLDLSDDEIPHVLSISYGDNEVSVPRKYAERVCSLFGLLTARGTTIVAASGDGGAKGASNSTCRTNDGSDKDVTMSVFPATCPWVTSVGGVTSGAEPFEGAEFSGGGFSQYFPREKWQDSSIKSYVKALDGHLNGHYNASNRGVPDISISATSFITRLKGQAVGLRGTSASAPVVAAMLALVNDARVRKGKEVLGWLNEVLYSEEVQAALQDVTKGESRSCDFRKGGSPGGWPAAKGWDAITGLGVPSDFQKLFDVLVDI
ncbi:tripeptidyl-peptidase sed2 [Fusarium phyllophilum]|uniref:tripeptidyl-peptidase II n=1 Tax=Fusarium phyllophilum TaxID=47803 RepID=A0A8H5JRA9_9HYPO|nr:tripeptidyl-peptidase sed2 [Fusarium phyllophilum]